MKDDALEIIKFLEYAEGLKRELRNNYLSNGRREDVAEHTWRMALMAIVVAPKTKIKLNFEKVIKMIIIHDIIEIESHDTPAVLHMMDNKILNDKVMREKIAINKITKLINKKSGNEIRSLWEEFEAEKTKESLFVKCLDKIEARIQKCQQPKDSLGKNEYDQIFIDKYSNQIEKYCMNDEILMDIAGIMKIKRNKLTTN